jgi:hypothetical protein
MFQVKHFRRPFITGKRLTEIASKRGFDLPSVDPMCAALHSRCRKRLPVGVKSPVRRETSGHSGVP